MIFLPAAKPKPLFGSEDVEWLKVDKSKQIGSGHQGTVYLGRIKFKRSKPRAVAVKIPHSSERTLLEFLGRSGREIIPSEISGEREERMREIIEAFRKAGVRMPKFGIVEHEGRNVLVSELLAGRPHPLANFRQSKLRELSMYRGWAYFLRSKPELALQIAEELGKMARAGWLPKNVEDVFHLHRTRIGLKPIVGEVDPLHYHAVYFPTHSKFTKHSLAVLDEFVRRFTEHETRPKIIKAIIGNAGKRFETHLRKRFSRL